MTKQSTNTPTNPFLGVRIPDHLLAWVKETAVHENRSTSKQVTQLIEEAKAAREAAAGK